MWHLLPRVFSITYASVAVYFLIYHASLFALHPFLMSVAFIVLMAEGIQVFHTPNIWFRTLPWEKKIKLHWIIQAATGLAVALGFLSIFAVKVSNGKNHFTTWHGTIGAASCTCVAFSVIGGVFNLYKLKLILLIKSYNVKRIHKCFGVITFLLGLTSIALGFMSGWAENQLNDIVRGVLISLLFPFGISVLYLMVR